MPSNLAYILALQPILHGIDSFQSETEQKDWQRWLASLNLPTEPQYSGPDDVTFRYPGHADTN